MPRLIDHVVEDSGRVYIALIGEEKLGEKELQLTSHLLADGDSPVLYLVFRVFDGEGHAISDRGLEKFVAHAWEEEERLDKRIEVACVADILEPNRHIVSAMPLIDR